MLVSDFDGTMTQHDFYQLVIESPLPANTPDSWAGLSSELNKILAENARLKPCFRD